MHPVRDIRDRKKIRIISSFAFRDRVILGLASRYLSSVVDPFLDKASIAFRQDHSRNAQAALRELQELNLARGTRPLFVAECDIRSFFDVLSHQVIEESIEMIKQRMAAAGADIDPRVLELVSAYLACYTFPKSVLPVLPVAGEKWPDKALQEFYPSPLEESLGIPQGGALSNILVNLVLDRADTALADYRRASGQPLSYWRYCDDSLIVAPDREKCEGAFKVYLDVLHSLRLPIHPPAELLPYLGNNRPAFWAAKSRPTYAWGGDVHAGEFPWISVWGVQFRYDGKVRLRPESVRKLHLKMSALARQLRGLADQRKQLGDTGGGNGTLPSLERIARFFKNKLMASAFGRNWQDPSRSSKLCWDAWAGILKCWPHDRGFLRGFDRHLGRLVAGLAGSFPKKDSTSSRKANSKRWSYFLNFYRRRSREGKVVPRGNS